MVYWPSRFRARTVKRTKQFSQEARELQPNARRLDEQLAGVEWAVATRPESFPLIPETQYRFLKTRAGLAEAPVIRVYFTIDDEEYCTLRHIVPEDPPLEPEDLTY